MFQAVGHRPGAQFPILNPPPTQQHTIAGPVIRSLGHAAILPDGVSSGWAPPRKPVTRSDGVSNVHELAHDDACPHDRPLPEWRAHRAYCVPNRWWGPIVAHRREEVEAEFNKYQARGEAKD